MCPCVSYFAEQPERLVTHLLILHIAGFSTAVKYCLAFLLGVVLFSEKFLYIIQKVYWWDLKCQKNDSTCTKILFIADPQIQGDLAAPTPLNAFYSWDSDRYLRLTFAAVISYFKPNIMVFLGDLMDEGSVSTTQQYHKYVKRLADIFDVHYPIVQVWLPGDNDIGGETEPVNMNKVETFRKIFDQPDVVKFRNISFYKVNGITLEYPQIPKGKKDRNFKMVVAHYPLLMRRFFTEKVNANIRPNIYFCAHDHGSKYIKQTKNFTMQYPHTVPFNDGVLEIDFSTDDLYEVYVPTCSYRMGTNKIGYGAAVLENSNQRMRYTVFWSPERFPTLYVYLGVLLCFIVYGLAFCAVRLCTKCIHVYKPIGNQLPFKHG